MSKMKRIEISFSHTPWFEMVCRKCNRIFYISKYLGTYRDEDDICEECLYSKDRIDLEDLTYISNNPALRRYDIPTLEKLNKESDEKEAKQKKEGKDLVYYTNTTKCRQPDESDIMRDLEDGYGEYHGH
jgi:hypothetical protein